jgi:hypothetical protein
MLSEAAAVSELGYVIFSALEHNLTQVRPAYLRQGGGGGFRNQSSYIVGEYF